MTAVSGRSLAGVDFLVPDPVRGLILNADGLARDLLLAGGGPRRCECRVVTLKCFGDGASGSIGPTVFVPNDLVSDFAHWVSSVVA